jgi:hypothetical protein
MSKRGGLFANGKMANLTGATYGTVQSANSTAVFRCRDWIRVFLFQADSPQWKKKKKREHRSCRGKSTYGNKSLFHPRQLVEIYFQDNWWKQISISPKIIGGKSISKDKMVKHLYCTPQGAISALFWCPPQILSRPQSTPLSPVHAHCSTATAQLVTK